MKSSKLIIIVRGFTKNEFKKFGDFIRSPYYNKNERQIKLYDFLKESFGEFEFSNITKESIAEYVFPEIKYNEQKVRTLVSEFIKLVEKFLVVIEGEQNSVFQKVQLIRALKDRDITRSFNTILKETLAEQEKEFNQDEDYYYEQYNLELESLTYKIERDESVHISDYYKITSNIDLFFIITKLTMLHFISHHKKDIKPDSDFDEWLFEEIISYIEENLSWFKNEHPIIYMKYLVLMSILHPDNEKYYRNLKNYSIRNWKKFNAFTRDYVFGSLKNYVIDKYNKGNIEFKKERFYIFQFIEDKNILNYINFISHTDFLNSISSALAVKNVKWAENFFNKYKNRLLPEFQEDVINLSTAQIYFAKNDFEKAKSFLNRVSYRKYYFYLRSKMMLAQMYYDSGEYEAAAYLVDAVRHYLIRKKEKMSVSLFDMFRNFFNYLGRLLNLSKADARVFKRELKDRSNVANKEWLLKKVFELSKKKK